MHLVLFVANLRPISDFGEADLQNLRTEFNEPRSSTFWPQIRGKAQHADSMNLRPHYNGATCAFPTFSGCMVSNFYRSSAGSCFAGEVVTVIANKPELLSLRLPVTSDSLAF